MDRGALHPDAATVNQADLAESPLVGRLQILVDHRSHVPRRERVQIERVLDGNPNRLVVAQILGPDITCFCQWS